MTAGGFDTDSLLQEFGPDLAEHIATLAAGIGRLGQSDDPARVDELFRAAHTIKGSARMLDLGPMAELAHAVEDVLQRVRAGEVALTGRQREAIAVGADVLSALLTSALAGREPGLDSARITAAIRASLAEPGGPGAPEPAAAPPGPAVAYRPAPAAADTVRVPRALLDRLAAAGERAGALAGALRLADRELRALSTRGSDPALVAQAGVSGDELASGLAGLAVRHARLATDLSEALAEVRDASQGLRMRRLRPLLDGLQRVARESARAEAKAITIVAAGGDVEIDARVLDAVADPLVQIVRNAVSHGIESVAERVAAGKPEAGQLTIAAAAHSGRVVIDVNDDGAGIDHRAVLARAVRLGAVGEDDASTLDPARALALIFLPGLSTRTTASENAGRGVGLDVVRRAVESVRGTIRVESDWGRGTTFRLELPAALSALRVLTVEDQGVVYAVPVEAVREVRDLRLRAGASDSATGQRRSLSDLLGVAPSAGGASRELELVLRDEAQTIVVVERVLTDDEVLVRALPETLAAVAGARGVASLATGETVLVVDPLALMALASSD